MYIEREWEGVEMCSRVHDIRKVGRVRYCHVIVWVRIGIVLGVLTNSAKMNMHLKHICLTHPTLILISHVAINLGQAMLQSSPHDSNPD
jgi:hypothetical protein